jgi:murein DD-endopeptidase MepM/ murein hydrolase activator NlpD
VTSPYQRAAIKTAKRYGLPTKIFLKLVNQESGWNPNATSPVGAKGLTQLMPATAASLGVDPNVPQQALDGGARYLRQQLDRFGTIKLALAAYNAGPGNVENGNWERIKETQRYVNAILGSTPGTEVSPSGGVKSEHTAPSVSPLKTPSDNSFWGDPLSQSAFESLGKVARGWKPTSALGGLVDAARAATPAPTTPTQGPLVPPSSGSAVPSSSKRQSFAATGKPIPGSYLTGIGGEHATAGLAGYPAHDYFGRAGAPVVAPVSGTIIRLSGHDPKAGPTQGVHGPFGWSLYLKGNDGRTYYLTHLGSRAVEVGQHVHAGAEIATVGDYSRFGGSNHVHMGVH